MKPSCWENLHTKDLCVQTMHTRKNLPDFRRKNHPLSYKCRGTTDRQKSDPKRFSGLLI